MATVTVITGLSGSGKTEYLNQMVDVIPFNEGVRPDKPENMEKFLDALGTGKDCAIVEIAYLTEYGRNELVRLVRERFPDTDFKWVYFKNDLETANANCLNEPRRDKKMREGNVANNIVWTQIYDIPDDAVPLEIFPIASLRKESDPC